MGRSQVARCAAFAKRMRDLIWQSRKTQREIAEAIGVSQSQVSKWTTEGILPDSDATVTKIANVFDIDEGMFLREVELYGYEVYLRSKGKLRDETVSEILSLIKKDNDEEL